MSYEAEMADAADNHGQMSRPLITAHQALNFAQNAIEAAMIGTTDNIVRTHLIDAANACIRARDRITAHQWCDQYAAEHGRTPPPELLE